MITDPVLTTSLPCAMRSNENTFHTSRIFVFVNLKGCAAYKIRPFFSIDSVDVTPLMFTYVFRSWRAKNKTEFVLIKVFHLSSPQAVSFFRVALFQPKFSALQSKWVQKYLPFHTRIGHAYLFRR